MGSRRKKSTQSGYVSETAGSVKKWYVITGVLALLSVLSISMWLVNSTEAGRYKAQLGGVRAEYEAEVGDVRAKYEAEVESLWARLIEVQGELGITKNDLADVTSELETIQATKELVFGDSLRVFDIDSVNMVEGKVQNIGDEAIARVCVVIAIYEEDGSLKDVVVTSIYDLNPQEVGEWGSSGKYGASYAVYAFGNRTG